MAWLEQQTNGIYHIAFRFDGERRKKSLRTSNQAKAAARLTRVEENIELVESGRLVVPDDVDLGSFLLSDGKLNREKSNSSRKRLRTLREFSTAFLSSIPENSLEESTI